MVRLTDLPSAEREGHLNRVATLPAFPATPMASGPALAKRRIALVTTAGLHLRSDEPFDTGGAGIDYRVIPGLRRDDLPAHPGLLREQAGSGHWWRPVAVP